MPKKIPFADYWAHLDPLAKRSLAKAAEVGYTYLSLIASGKRQPGAVAAIRIERATRGVIRRGELRPDLFGKGV